MCHVRVTMSVDSSLLVVGQPTTGKESSQGLEDYRSDCGDRYVPDGIAYTYASIQFMNLFSLPPSLSHPPSLPLNFAVQDQPTNVR